MTPTTLPAPLAITLLATITGPRVRASPPPQPSAELLEALTETFGPATDAPAPTQAELARAALAVAVDDPVMGDAIEVMLDRDTISHETFPMGETIDLAATVTAALAVLQTEVTFERGPAGKYTVRLHTKAASDAALRGLAQAIVRAAPQTPK
jgi:DNA gyrase inhibitor GyrI